MNPPPDPSPTPDLPAILARADRLAAARAKATPGPWETIWDLPTNYKIGSHGRCLLRLEPFPIDGSRFADGDFVVLARNLAIEDDVRALAAEVERQTAEIERLQEIEAAARHYVECAQSQDHYFAPFVNDNGRHGSSPWAELVQAIRAAQPPPGGVTP